MAQIEIVTTEKYVKTTALDSTAVAAAQTALNAERNTLHDELEAVRAAQAAHRANIVACGKTIAVLEAEVDTSNRTAAIQVRKVYDDTDDTVRIIELDGNGNDVGEIESRAPTASETAMWQAAIAPPEPPFDPYA